MRFRRASFLLFALSATFAAASNWPNWRGPNGDGTAPDAHNLPETWNTEKNIKWKQEMPAWSGSTPCVWGDRIFLNSPSKEEIKAEPEPERKGPPGGGKKRPRPKMTATGPGGQEILLLCLSRATGKEMWRHEYDRGNEIKQKQNMSSPTPITDGKLIWVTSGNAIAACFDYEGNLKWKFDIPKNYGKVGIQFGYGSSPILIDGKLIFQMLQGFFTHEPSYLFALDATTGQPLWHVERWSDAEFETNDAYTSPTIAVVNGKKQLVVSGGAYVTGHDPENGKELWRGGGFNPTNSKNFRTIASPLVKDGMIFTPTRVNPLIAFRTGGSGDITKDAAWKWTTRGSPDVPTPVSDGERLYMADDQGAITCVQAKTGELIYGPEQTGIGRVSGSPVLADGKIYLTSESTETAVIEAGPKFRLIGKSTLDGSYTLGTPAFVDSEIILRTGTHLYCISKSP